MTFTTNGSAVVFTTSGTAVTFTVTPAVSGFTTSPTVTPGAHASSHGAGGADPITTLGTVAFNAGAAATPTVAFTGDPNTGIYSPGADQVALTTAGTARVTVGATGLVGIGTTPAYLLDLAGTSRSFNAARFSADATGVAAHLNKSRSATVGSHGAVQDADQLGAWVFNASDGTNWVQAAVFSAYVDGTPGLNDMPASMRFAVTADGASSATERLRISQNGQLTISAGSVAGPVLSTQGDTNTGIYFPAADSVAIAAGGTAVMSITSAGVVTGSGRAYGAWTTFSPTLSNWGIGSGTITAVYCQVGKTVHARYVITFAADSTFASYPYISLPVAAVAGAGDWVTAHGRAKDASVGSQYVLSSQSTTTDLYITTGSPQGTLSSTVPFTWTTSDVISLQVTYEAA